MPDTASRWKRAHGPELRLASSRKMGRVLRSVADLRELKARLNGSGPIGGRAGTEVTVGLGVCGLMASADKAFDAIVDELAVRHIHDVVIRRSGCMGYCSAEPIVMVDRPGMPVTRYPLVSPEDARRIVVQHIVNGNIVPEIFLRWDRLAEDGGRL